MAHFDLELPTDNTPATRIAWAGERIWDYSEGLMPKDVGWFVWNAIVGWADLCTDNERRQYLELARQLQQALQGES